MRANRSFRSTTTEGADARVGSRSSGTNASLWTIRDGKIVRVVWFGSRDAALDAAGLSK